MSSPDARALLAAALVVLAVPAGALALQPTYARVVFFEETFETGTLGKFTEKVCPNEPFSPLPATSGPCCAPGPTFWHAEGMCNACVTPSVPLGGGLGTHAAAYNRMDETPPNCTYDTPGQPNAAALETGTLFWPAWPPVPMQIGMTFHYVADVQHVSTGFDRLYLEVDTGQNPGACGNDWSVVTSLPSSFACQASVTLVAIANHPLLDSMAGSSRPFRFRFDTIDATENQTKGVYLDNVRLLNSYCTPCVGIDSMTLCVPRIESTGGEPRIGNLGYGLRLIEAPSSSAAAVLVLGTSQTSWLGIPLPWSIPFTQGVFGTCLLCVSADVLIPVPVSGSGTCGRMAVQGLGIPAVGALAGAQVYAQWAVMDPLQPGALLTTDAAALVVQP